VMAALQAAVAGGTSNGAQHAHGMKKKRAEYAKSSTETGAEERTVAHGKPAPPFFSREGKHIMPKGKKNQPQPRRRREKAQTIEKVGHCT